MSTRSILSTEQQKHTLLGKKKSKKTIIRNVLATPYCNYWPLVGPEDEVQICNILRKQFSTLKQPKVNIPWNIMKSIPKDERKAFRSHHIKFPPKNYRSNLVFGVNETTKLLEANAASSVLITSDVDPKFLVKHVVDMCVFQKISVLVIPNLKNLLKEVVGLPSLTIAFKTNQKDYYKIVEKIEEIYENYKPPMDHINFNRPCRPIDCAMDVNECENNLVETKDIYLYRQTVQRVFIPKLSVQRNSLNSFTQVKMEDNEYIGIDNASIQLPPSSNPHKNVKVSYKSLLLKRIINDKNRDMKKIQRLKMNSK